MTQKTNPTRPEIPAVLHQKNYFVLTLLLVFCGLIFGLTVVKIMVLNTLG